MKIQIDTSTVEQRDRFEFWRESVCKSYAQADATFEEGGSSDAPLCRLYSARFGQTLLSKLEAPRHNWSRERRHISKDDKEIYMVSLTTDGHGRLSQFGRQAVQAPGNIVIYDSSAPFSYGINGPVFILKIPKKVLEARLVRVRELLAVPFETSSPLCRMLAGMMVEASSIAIPDDQEIVAGGRIANSMIDVLVSMCEILRDDNPQVIDTARLQKVMRFVRANLHDPDLSPDAMSSVAGMSLRSLNRAFGELGTTPMKWVWTERLAASQQALETGRVRSVTEATFSFGFKDLAHFSRSYKKAYGKSPRTALGRFSH
ncbi:helix-turn-helix domain-containing protein [Pseudotabrizicola sp. 4114]|uniref:helix-turn-helix domain-containing protein n=1 Tax=Pseudotabrizicola sp. 4114 TaxID=2817731 RepID=UPI00285C2A29|nr:AraC-like DNA-binding protein [Pseudorhodobacter sp. 4114]